MIAVLVVLFGLAACKAGKTDTASANLPAGDALLKESSAAMHDIKTAQFVITSDGAVAGLNLHKAEGTLTREGSAKGTAQIDQSGVTVEVSFVIVGDKIYLKGPTGGYQELPASLIVNLYDPGAILDPSRGVANVLAKVHDARTEATEDVDGVATYRVKGKVAKDDVAHLVPGISSDVDITFWLRKDGDHQPVKASVAVPANGSPTVDVKLSDVDKPVEITAPQ